MSIRFLALAALVSVGVVGFQTTPVAEAAPTFAPQIQSQRFSDGAATVTVSIVRKPCTASNETQGGKPVYSCL